MAHDGGLGGLHEQDRDPMLGLFVIRLMAQDVGDRDHALLAALAELELLLDLHRDAVSETAHVEIVVVGTHGDHALVLEGDESGAEPSVRPRGCRVEVMLHTRDLAEQQA